MNLSTELARGTRLRKHTKATPAEHGNGQVAPGHAAEAAPGVASCVPAFTELLAVLALRRLASRLRGERDGSSESPRPFLEARRDEVVQNLRRGLRRALRALEFAARGEVLWDRVSAALPREPRHLLLPQAWGLRDVFSRPADPTQSTPALAKLALSLQQLRQNLGDTQESQSSELLARAALGDGAAGPADTESRLIAPVADALDYAGEEALAQLLQLRSRHGAVLLVGLVDYFTCRALHADPRLSAKFVFVHVQRPQELWEGDVDALARVVEEHAACLGELLDDRPPAEAGAGPRGTQRDNVMDRLFQQGLDSYQVADYRRAVTLFSAALRHASDHPVLYAYRGDAYRLMCEYDLALADYSAALRLNPSAAAVLAQRAAVYRLKGNLRHAIADCSKAIALDPNHAAAYLGRGDAYLDLAELDLAIADFTVAIAQQAESPWGHYGRGSAHLRKEAYDEAIADFTRVLALHPHHVLARLQRGDACREQGNAAQAILDYSEVLRYHPRNATAYAARGAAFEQDGDIDRALGDYNQVLRLDAKNANVYCRRGILLRRKGEPDRALADLDASIHHETDNADAHYNRGLIFMARGLIIEARLDFDAALQLRPAMVVGFLARALAHDALGRQPEGIQDCTRALHVDAQCTAAYLIRGVLASRAGQYAQALADLTRTIEMDPNLPVALHERGMVCMLQGEYDNAIADYSRMLELNPTSALAYASRGVVRQMQGDHAQAVADFARALEINPKSILAGWHQSTNDGIRRRTTQMLVEYIEGLWHQLQVARSERRRQAAPRPEPLPDPDGQSTAELPVIAIVEAEEETAPKPRRRRTPVADGAEATQSTPQQQAGAVAAAPAAAANEPDVADDTAGELLLLEDDTAAAPAAETVAAPAEPVVAPETPPPTVYQCPSCRALGVPSERLPDRRVRCASCQAAFVPTRTPTLNAMAKAPPTAAAQPAAGKPKKPPIPVVEREGGMAFTLWQKVIVGTAAALVAIVLVYYFFPSFESLMAAAPGPSGKRISPDDLIGEFVRNRTAAGRKYEEASLCICGEVAEVFEAKQTVRFKGRDAKFFVEAGFRTDADRKNVQKDQKISISGECAGWQKGGGVRIINCKVFPYEEPVSAQLPLGLNK